MRPDDRIAEWTKARRTADAAPDFADRVMAAASDEHRGRALRIVVVSLATVVGAARVAAALAVFFPR